MLILIGEVVGTVFQSIQVYEKIALLSNLYFTLNLSQDNNTRSLHWNEFMKNIQTSNDA